MDGHFRRNRIVHGFIPGYGHIRSRFKDVTTAIFVLLKEFPLYSLMSVIMLVLIVIFLVTSADSAVFVLGMMTSDGDLNPSNMVKVIWGVLMAGITAVLIASSGLKGLQTASLVTALPFTIILGIISVSLFKSLSRETKEVQKQAESVPLKKAQ